uniref:ATP synthase F0 subunit 8 n=1 Tax=Chonosia atrodorsalis TaxID=2219931 RepID=A0A3S7MGE3_9HEMI|nr:ATP synthase F0 subunit 8 [Chonosia atrodorsalis]
MPQMSPMYWLMLMFYFILTMVFLMTFIYFYYFSISGSCNINMIKHQFDWSW